MAWKNAKASATKINKNQSIDFSVDINNNGSIIADEVVQLYITIDNAKEELPIASLVNFKRVNINKGETTTVNFSVPYSEFSYINSKGEKVQHKGKATISIANAAPCERSIELGTNVLKFEVMVN